MDMKKIKLEITLDHVKELMDMFTPEYHRNGNIYFQDFKDFPAEVYIVQEEEIHDATSNKVVVGKIPFYRLFLVFEKE